MNIGIVDLGSNSLRFVIYSWDGKELVKKKNFKRQAQSAKFIEHNEMRQAGIDNIISILKEFMIIARAYKISDTHIFGTAAIRNVSNSKEIKTQIEDAIDREIDILSGDEEGLFGFEGIKQMENLPSTGISVDVGGASTEITYFDKAKALHTISIPVGSLNTYLNFVHNVLPSNGEIMLMRLEIQSYLNQIEWLKDLKVEEIVGIGGSARAIMRLHRAYQNGSASIYDMEISEEDFSNYLKIASKNSIKLLKTIVNNIPERLTTLMPGSIIIHDIMEKVEAKNLKLSPYGVREGYFYTKVLKK